MDTEELFAQLEALQLANQLLQMEVDTLKRQLAAATGTPLPEPERPLTVYPTFEAIKWADEQWPDTKETWSRPEFSQIAMQRQIYGPKIIKPPYRHVIVEGEGEIMRASDGWDATKKRGGVAAPDWYLIAVMRYVDLLAAQHCCYVQAGDDRIEEDAPDQVALVEKYARKGYGFRHAPSEWDAHSRGAELAAVYQTVRPFPKADYQSKRIEVAPAP